MIYYFKKVITTKSEAMIDYLELNKKVILHIIY